MMSENQRIIQLKELLRDQPQDAFMNYALALEYVKYNHLTLAEERFSYLINDHPDYVGTYYHFGKFLEGLERHSEAKTIYEKGIALTSRLKDSHSLSELNSALMNLNISLDEL